ncbi:MAG: CRISPR-associated endonuclease Cas2 [Candidatus Sericytochromatia bacterium]|nr:CRISPR-associated endonuclease Cas2 [Candidatus Sericytochromatia bacterium]
MFVVVTYDIQDDRRRARVAKRMEDFGTRVQFSVFDCVLDERRFLDMRHILSTLIDPTADSVRLYRLCARCRGQLDILGAGRIVEDRRVIIL